MGEVLSSTATGLSARGEVLVCNVAVIGYEGKMGGDEDLKTLAAAFPRRPAS